MTRPARVSRSIHGFAARHTPGRPPDVAASPGEGTLLPAYLGPGAAKAGAALVAGCGARAEFRDARRPVSGGAWRNSVGLSVTARATAGPNRPKGTVGASSIPPVVPSSVESATPGSGQCRPTGSWFFVVQGGSDGCSRGGSGRDRLRQNVEVRILRRLSTPTVGCGDLAVAVPESNGRLVGVQAVGAGAAAICRRTPRAAPNLVSAVPAGNAGSPPRPGRRTPRPASCGSRRVRSGSGGGAGEGVADNRPADLLLAGLTVRSPRPFAETGDLPPLPASAHELSIPTRRARHCRRSPHPTSSPRSG